MGRPPAIGGPDQLALRHMARDAQRAVGAPQRKRGWSTEQGTILFDMPDGRMVVYHREDDRLLRTVLGEPHESDRVKLLVDELMGEEEDR